MQRELSTNKASKELQKKLGVPYGIGKKTIEMFYTQTNSCGNIVFWERKPNFIKLVEQNGTIQQIKDRVKPKILKRYGVTIEKKIPRKENRKKLYLKIYKKRLERQKEKSPLPNGILQNILFEEIGHWDKEHQKGVKDKYHEKTKKNMDEEHVATAIENQNKLKIGDVLGMVWHKK